VRRVVILAVLSIAVGLVWFGTQTVGQDHGADPRGKVFVLGWLETELWVNPWLVGIGVLMIMFGVVLLVRRPKTAP
jgi:hypothetical protein